jgi:hypothetical protein
VPTVAQLAASESPTVAYLLVISGWRVAWTNQPELVGSGGGSWIGTEFGDRVVALGLEPPQSIKMGCGILESGMLINDAAEFGLVDRDGYIIAHATDEIGTAVYERLAASTSPAPSTLIGAGGESVTIRDRDLNGEWIGADGERHMYQVLPSGAQPPPDHAAIDSTVQDLRASTVRTAARWLEGRAVALYIIRQDPDSGTWAPWDEQAEGGGLVWWGSLTGATAESHAWKFQADGPSAWLRRPLNVTAPADWSPLRPLVEFGPGEDRFGAAFCYSTASALRQLAASSIYTASDLLTADTAPGIADEINTRLQTVAADMGPDVQFSTWYSGQVSVTDDSIALRVADNNGGGAYGGMLYLRMHRVAWLALGWDLTLQHRPANELSTTTEVQADLEPGFAPVWLDETADPAPGYLGAYFHTCPVGLYYNDAAGKVDGDGAWRVWTPITPGGIGLLRAEAGQSWQVGFGLDVPYWEGQLARPPADKLLDAGACNATGFLAVRGPFKGSADGEVETHYQLAKVSWKKSTVATAIALDSDSRAIVWAESWLDPRQFGAPNGPIADAWAVNINGGEGARAEFVPCALLGYRLSGPDLAHVVLARLLLSSGTASWSGYEGEFDAAITPGDNGPAEALLAVGEDLYANDMEIADLGLCIPEELVDWPSFIEAAEALPGGKAGPLNRTRLAYVGPLDSQQAIEDVLRPRGWCMSLRGGRYGVFARSAPLDAADVDATISPADIAGNADDLPPWETVDFRPLEPIDLCEISYGRNQLGDGGDEKTVSIKARDPRAAMRRGNATVEIDGRSLTADGAWIADARTLWGEQLARFFAEPHALVTVKVKGSKGLALWPGSTVRYTSPWPATRAGSYGMTAAVGRVVSVSRDLQSLATTCEILVAAGDTTTTGRRFAPIARLIDGHATVEARHNAATRTIFCYSDAFGRGGSVSDVAAFAEPDWLGVGGVMLARVWQSWDGVTWEATASFEVESVNTTASSITYAADSLTGTIWETRYGVVLPAVWDDQGASSWPTALFGVVAGSDGKHSAGNEPAYPWSP